MCNYVSYIFSHGVNNCGSWLHLHPPPLFFSEREIQTVNFLAILLLCFREVPTVVIVVKCQNEDRDLYKEFFVLLSSVINLHTLP